MANETHGAQRIIVVSNRLPFSIEQTDGRIKFSGSPGGVATGLKSLLDSMPGALPFEPDYLWVGWPGATVSDEHREQLRSRARLEFRSHPVFLSEEDFENFYQGFCNKTIWPLFHYFPSNAEYDESYWRQYQRVNRVFCDTLLTIIRQDDLVWIHDYHLMLLPDLLRKAAPKIRIGFFFCTFRFPNLKFFGCCRRSGGAKSWTDCWALISSVFTPTIMPSISSAVCSESWVTSRNSPM
jgi:trehalose 6-phosphate synthase/phosphatase